MKHSSRQLLRALLLSAFLLTVISATRAQSPEVSKVEPPSWWAESSIKPVRLLIHGHNLKGARVTTAGAGLRVGPVQVNPAGTYLFVDVAIGRLTKPGNYRLRITTTNDVPDHDRSFQ
jgi:hypothetical protein